MKSGSLAKERAETEGDEMSRELGLRLDRKQAQILNRCLLQLFSKHALEPLTVEQTRKIDFIAMLRRRVRVAANGQEALMTPASALAFDRVVDVLAETSSASDQFTPSDIATAVRKVYESCWQKLDAPENADELLDQVRLHITAKISNYTFVAVLGGVKLERAQEMLLGQLRLVGSLQGLIAENEVNCESDWSKNLSSRLLELPCLTGRHTGTYEAAKR